MVTMVREGKKVVPSCSDCGCRLNVFTIEGMSFAHHFAHAYDPGRDAKGHICDEIGRIWSFENKSLLNDK